MNSLTEQFGSAVAILGFPCNQFGHQTNCGEEEMLNSLKYVRPGNGYEPKFQLFGKVEVNGASQSPLFAWLKSKLPFPHDPVGESGDQIINDLKPQPILWAPVCRSDIGWNFEKFLVDADGVPVRRYSPKYETIKISEDIKTLLSAGKLE
eukprot:m.65491 g.65491  ORF g.65491 m.65491 type:complete len:150 (-) comp13669_c0_seq1:208-657(-)